jgi:chromate transporter
MIYFKLFFVFFKIGIFSFGGGYAMLPLIEMEIITNNAWISKHTFIDIIATSQITPGPVAINCATFIGYRIGGPFGSLISTLGVILFPSLLILLIARFMLSCNESRQMQAVLNGLKPALVGMILASAFSVGKTAIFDAGTLFIAAFTMFILFKAKIDPVKILFTAGVLGFILYR